MRWRWPPENSWGYKLAAWWKPDLGEHLGDTLFLLRARTDVLDPEGFADD